MQNFRSIPSLAAASQTPSLAPPHDFPKESRKVLKMPNALRKPKIENALTRPLTKSRFKIAQECPTKLFYTNKPEIYGDKSTDDAFLAALAEGGFQVGKLAQLEFPDGNEITSTDYESSEEETRLLLSQKEVTIYEAAFRYENLFVRADIVKKIGDTIFLYEVKAKSFAPNLDSFYDKTQLKKDIKKITSAWAPYLYDIAFQHYVVSKAYPTHKVIPYLMHINKTKVATIEGLNQYFVLAKNERGRTYVKERPGLRLEMLGDSILHRENVTEAVNLIQTNKDNGKNPPERLNSLPFTSWVGFLSTQYLEDKKIPPSISNACRDCQFRIKPADYPANIKSGFDECWKEALGTPDRDRTRPRVFDLWYNPIGEKLIEAKRYFLDQVIEADLTNLPDKKPGLSRGQRQWKQVELHKKALADPHIELDDLKKEIKSWDFPYHFIDFETTTVAIPFHKGMRPYEVIAFQFSHHVMYEDGKIEHKGEYFNAEQGKFPNFEFARELKKELETDNGTIFRYADHENTVLNQIIRQLEVTEEKVPDKEGLIAWIKTITHGPKNDKTKEPEWVGKRNMVDLLKVVTRYYLHSSMGGSNSIKVVLPAVLNASEYLQKKYSQPTTSRNFKEPVTWVKKDANGKVIDPYKALPPVFKDCDQEIVDRQFQEDEIKNGGAALVAYARMQFTEMSKAERELLRSALLKYCELDTLAMVMVVEGFGDWHK